MNVMSALILSQKKGNNPCLWYFITLILDTTLGILIAYIILKIIENVSKQYGWSKLISGNYSEETEEENDLAAWALQLMVWVTIVAVTKGFLLFSTLYFNSFFTQVGKYILDPFQSKPKAELVFVMIIVPTIMNIFQFWVQDNFLKSKI
jgi:STIMATE family